MKIYFISEQEQIKNHVKKKLPYYLKLIKIFYLVVCGPNCIFYSFRSFCGKYFNVYTSDRKINTTKKKSIYYLTELLLRMNESIVENYMCFVVYIYYFKFI